MLLELRCSVIYVNGDDGYLWLTCGRCEEPLHCIDAGDSLNTLVQEATDHHCPP